VCTVPPPAIPLPAMWMSDEIPGAVGGVDKAVDNGGYESLLIASSPYEAFDIGQRPLPAVPVDSRPAPPVKPRPKPEIKPSKSADDNDYLHFS